LAPKAPEYARLMKEKLALEAALRTGWGAEVAAEKLQPGDAGTDVVALRDRLVALGYLGRSATQAYDKTIQVAVQRFQLDHGLLADGVAGSGTLAEINVGPQARLQSVIVAMERLRWMGDAPRGARHIWVNQPDFTAQIIDDGKVVFQTRAVIGKNVADQRSPEFSDMMEHMVVNPSWGVPRSIIVKEYLPLLQQNPNAVSHLQVIDGSGRVVPRGAVNFAAYSARSFPFGLRQPPSDGNALGKVKFMFPNPYNIYLHDTPAKELFGNEVRAYSHGCIRLADPFDFAYALLSRQVDDPKAEFASHLATDRETVVKLVDPVPVHLVYFTAWPTAKGQMTYRRDVYGRDGRIFDALTEAGVVLGGVQG
jgi:murein L,D-transpeptidase YcbB/YkuD